MQLGCGHRFFQPLRRPGGILQNMLQRGSGRLDINISLKVFANQPAYVTWTADMKGYGWSLCIFPIEMSVPDDKPADFICAWAPSSLIDICICTSPTLHMSDRDKIYAQGYYSGWHSLPITPYPDDLRRGVKLWSDDPSRD